MSQPAEKLEPAPKAARFDWSDPLLLEDELRATQDLLVRLVERLETQFGEDIDGDGTIGTAARPGSSS